ncbi:MAG TPA: serine/threonine-protein kinase, partial [Kofleriaceae bacterium]|nr:serine/threonine-protein kinase [Kofleriaceae bacterium]
METLLSTAGGQAPLPSQIPDLLPQGAKAGPWIVERELGRGGMGAVYAVVHDEIGKRAALKVVHSRLLDTGFNPDRMLVEARVVNHVGHPNIVDIFETGKLPDGRPYIVMERLDGQSLAHRVDAGRLDPELAIAILRQICDALIAAHAAGIIHRDLKLDNVFLVDNLDEPNTPKVKILDWGIAKIVHHDARHTIEGQLVGTPQYLSPEQARGSKVSPKTDVYSLGVMAYELFLDQLPFEAETSAEIMAMHLRATPPPPHELWPEIPPQLEQLLLEMLAKRADARPSMLEVANRLEGVLAELQHRRSSEIAALARPATISEPVPVQDLPRTPGSQALPAFLPPPPFDAPRALRRLSAEAHAPTKLATWRPRLLPRWRYIAGGLAIAGCLVLLLVSRGDDQVASAAAPPDAEAETETATAEAAIAAPIAPVAAAIPAAAPVAAAAIAAIADDP